MFIFLFSGILLLSLVVLAPHSLFGSARVVVEILSSVIFLTGLLGVLDLFLQKIFYSKPQANQQANQRRWYLSFFAMGLLLVLLGCLLPLASLSIGVCYTIDSGDTSSLSLRSGF